MTVTICFEGMLVVTILEVKIGSTLEIEMKNAAHMNETSLESVKKKLHTASTEIEQVGTRSRVLEKKLRNVECLPEHAAPALRDAEDESSPAGEEE